MNSLSHNSLLQGLRLLNRHMLQTTQLVINSLRELALPEYKCMNGKNVRIIIMRSMYRFDPMSESIWSQAMPSKMSRPLVHLDSTSSVCLSPKPLYTPCVTTNPPPTPVPCLPLPPPSSYAAETKSSIFLVVFPLKEWTAYQSPLAGNDETDWQ